MTHSRYSCPEEVGGLATGHPHTVGVEQPGYVDPGAVGGSCRGWLQNLAGGLRKPVPSLGAHRDLCTGTLYYYTLLLYGTAEDMTTRPNGPQVTSRACVQRDTEGLRQGEWPQHMVTCLGEEAQRPGLAGRALAAAPGCRLMQSGSFCPCAEKDSPPFILAQPCLLLDPNWQQQTLYSHTQQPVTEGQAGCHPHHTCWGSLASDHTASPCPSHWTSSGSHSGHQSWATVLVLLARAYGRPLSA